VTPDVVALYVAADGPYPRLVEEWYDAKRDARTYAGPRPVVAHPPCGPWSALRCLCTKQDEAAGPHGVAMVRRYGGVLEHPARSLLFRACTMPRPGELPDEYGGRTYELRQVAWGHKCEKPTWIYVVGVPQKRVLDGMRTGGIPTHRITSGPRGPKLPSASRKIAAHSPPLFAAWLVDIASQVRL
jgi:hypothetical protein